MDEASVEPTAGVAWTLGWCDVMITQPAKVNVRDKSYLDEKSAQGFTRVFLIRLLLCIRWPRLHFRKFVRIYKIHRTLTKLPTNFGRIEGFAREATNLPSLRTQPSGTSKATF